MFFFLYFGDLIHWNASTWQRETKIMRHEEYSRMKDWKRKKKFSLNSWKSKIVIREIVKTIYFVREIVEMKKIVREIVNWPPPGGGGLLNL